MSLRRSYDTKVKYLVKQGLLPERYKQNIHRSLICKWKQEPVEKYIGYKLNVGMDELYDLMKAVSENQHLQKAIRAYYRINKTLRDIIGKGRDYVNKIREYKKEVIAAIQQTAKAITKKRALKLLGISIYLVIDNFSRYILSWRVSDKLCAKTRLETFEESIAKLELKRKTKGRSVTPIPGRTTQLIVDGGSENNNGWVDQMLKRYPKSVKKIVAMRDLLKSNSMAESVNKILKYQYLFHKEINGHKQLEAYMQSSVRDYNSRRPHGALSGLTPEESYFGKKLNLKKTRAKIKEVIDERILWNQSHSCKGCPFGCAHG